MIWILSVVALFAAMLSAVAGVGGGTILIAVMFALGMTPVLAVPLHAAVQAISNATRALAYRRDLDYSAAGWFVVSCLPLPFLTAPLVARADVDVIRLVLAAVILVSLLPAPQRALPGSLRRRMLLAGVVNGSVGMLIGATGLVIGPFFMVSGWSKERIVGTLALCQALGHVIKIIAFASFGFALAAQLDLLLALGLAVALGTGLGRVLMHQVSQRVFVWLFRISLSLLALRLGWSGLVGVLG